MSAAQGQRPGLQPSTDADRSGEPSVDDLVALAGRISAVRAARKELLPAGKFGEPGWDMMLALYLATLAGQRMTVSNMCEASDAPPTTALRWLDRLIELDLVTKKSHPTDARVIYVTLQPDSEILVKTFLLRAWSTFYSDK